MKKNKPANPPKKRGKATPVQDDWLVQEDIRTDVVDPSKVHQRAKWLRRSIFAGPVVAVVALGLVASVNNQMGELGTKVDGMNSEVSMETPGKNVAMIALNDWLTSPSKPLPNANVLSWDGKKTLAEYALVADPDTGEMVESLGREAHKFTLVNGTGLVYTSTVITVDAPGRGAKVLGTPSLLPKIPDASESLVATTWTSLEAGTSTEHIQTAVDAWTSAYTSGDPAALRQAVGDPTATNSYMPMMQVKKATTIVNEVGVSEELTEADRAVVNVTMTVLWDGATEKSDTSLPTVSFDLLVDKASTASPVVVSWSAGGLGEDLLPYQNAATSLNITADDDSVSVTVNDTAEGTE